MPTLPVVCCTTNLSVSMARPVVPSVVVALAVMAKAVEETVSVVVAEPVPRRMSPPVTERSPGPAARPSREPSVPEYESPVPSESVVVATLAKVFTPEKYGRLPTTAWVEVESPPKESVAPVSICGQVAVRVSCFALKVSQSVPVRHPFTPLAEEVHSKVPLAPPMNWPRVPEYVIGAGTVGVEVAVEYRTPPDVLLRVPAVERF